jgi:hypothetical protein
MKQMLVASALAVTAVSVLSAQTLVNKNGNAGSDTLILSRSVYQGTTSTVNVGQTLPPGCVAGTVKVPTLPLSAGKTTNVTVACATAVADGTYPTVFNNDGPDGSFGVTSPIYLDNISKNGKLLGTYAVPSNLIVTSFSSKSELALHLSADGKSITFVGYQGGPGFVTGPNELDVSNSNTPGVIDPTNPVVSQYYRAVAEVDADGNLQITDGNAYSGNNGRSAIKGSTGAYYLAGNNNNGGLSKSQLLNTQVGVNLITSTGAELLIPGQTPPVPPGIDKIGDFEITQLGYPTPDKAGKDNNFRGITIFNNTLYVTKGSGGNGINTVYQVGNAGVLPTGNTAQLASEPITVLPGFPTTLASGVALDGSSGNPVAYPFGIWFADANTLYVCDEGDGTLVSPAVNGNVATPASQATAGVQKWLFDGATWNLAYVLNNGLNIGIPYNISGYPSPATDGCRSLTGKNNGDGTVDLYAVTSTVSASGDQGADPNLLVTVKDQLKATTPSNGLGTFQTLRTAGFGEVLRGVSFAPSR